MSATILPFPERQPGESLPVGGILCLDPRLTVAVMHEAMIIAEGGVLPMPMCEHDVLVRKAAYALLAVHAYHQDLRG